MFTVSPGARGTECVSSPRSTPAGYISIRSRCRLPTGSIPIRDAPAFAAFDLLWLRRSRRRQDRDPPDDACADRGLLRLGLQRHGTLGCLGRGGRGDLRLPVRVKNSGERLVDRGGDGFAVV